MRTTTVVIGAGHSGLAASYFLSARGIDHVVLERGEVANTWRTERWDSLRLLTPNWQVSLPGLAYDGDDPDGFMTVTELVGVIDRYARLVNPPLQTRTTVTSVRPDGDGYQVVTDRGVWRCRSVILASGGFNLPKVPPIAAALPDSVRSVTPARVPPPLRYRRWRGAGGGGVRHRHPARRGDPSIRASGHRVGGGARPHAQDLPRVGISGTGWT